MTGNNGSSVYSDRVVLPCIHVVNVRFFIFEEPAENKWCSLIMLTWKGFQRLSPSGYVCNLCVLLWALYLGIE